jgi:hypothetical protein
MLPGARLGPGRDEVGGGVASILWVDSKSLMSSGSLPSAAVVSPAGWSCWARLGIVGWWSSLLTRSPLPV